MMLSLFNLLMTHSPNTGGLQITVITEHEGTLAVDLAELERDGLISTSQSISPRNEFSGTNGNG
jgi:hypothetical protein